jgi:hypothetical protein
MRQCSRSSHRRQWGLSKVGNVRRAICYSKLAAVLADLRTAVRHSPRGGVMRQSKSTGSSTNALEQQILSELVKNFTAVLSLAGIVIYGAVAYGSSIFYHFLGTDLLDVGASYGVILTNSIFIIAVLALALATQFFMLGRIDRENRQRRMVGLLFFGLFGLGLMAILAPLATALFVKADIRVSGWSFSPVVRVQPVVVHATAKSGEVAPSVDALVGHPLYYLGQSGGTAVFFDVTTQKGVYVPNSLIIIEGRRPSRDPPLVNFIRELF